LFIQVLYVSTSQFGAKSQTVVVVHCDVGENQMSTKAVSQEQ